MIGKVIEFDEHVGLGVVIDGEGNEFPFHCVNISDGSRKISVGQNVSFETFIHPRGRAEATSISPQQ